MQIIGMTSGELFYPALDKAVKAGIEAIGSGFTHYSPTEGIYELRELIASHYRKSQADVMPENVLITGGARHAIYNVLGRVLDPGDEVIVPTPYWFSFPSMIHQARGKMVVLKTSAANDFRIEPEQLEALITPRTKLIIITNPCNPSGKIYTEEELNSIVEVMHRHPHVYVLSDEIYEFINYGDRPFRSISSWQSIADRVVTVNGFSKSFSMSGWRVGFIVATEKLIMDLKEYQEVTHSGISIFTQKAASAAWHYKDDFLPPLLKQLNSMRHKGADLLNSIPGVNCSVPDATYYFFPDVSGLFGKLDHNGERIRSSLDMTRYIFNDSHVQVLCGDLFGDANHVRISFGMDEEKMMEGLQRIRHSLEKLNYQ
jgi:aspartate aminotransferase